MDIDWSKAPEGFDYYLLGKSLMSPGKFYMKVDSVQRYVSASGSFVDFIDAGEFDIEQRPETAPAWVGVGLPPVGITCIMKGYKYDPEACDWEKYKEHVGKEVTIVAHHEVGEGFVAAVYACKVGMLFEYYSMVAGCFEPVRTPEQIAAEARQHAIYDLADELAGHPDAVSKRDREMAAYLYDQGYRKQVAP